MKEGTIFDHPTKDGGVVRLKAVKEVDGCRGCAFESIGCNNERLYRDNRITGDCVKDEVIYVEDQSNKLPRIMQAVRDNTKSYGEEQDAILEKLISKILEE